MLIRDLLRAGSLSNLTEKRKAELKKTFEARRKELQRALAAVERGLAEPSRPAKRPVRRRGKKR
jgi:hypothetical protein